VDGVVFLNDVKLNVELVTGGAIDEGEGCVGAETQSFW
jgi:hypothetical protein